MTLLAHSDESKWQLANGNWPTQHLTADERRKALIKTRCGELRD